MASVHIPDSAFADDDGSAHPAVSAALTAYSADRTLLPEALDTLQQSRLLVPVVAVLGEVEIDEEGLAHDKTSDMAAVLVQGADGRMALLAFTSLDAMRAWNPEARPVPVSAQDAARSARYDEAAALVVDIAGPVTIVVQGEDLTGFAEGWSLARAGDRSVWVR